MTAPSIAMAARVAKYGETATMGPLTFLEFLGLRKDLDAAKLFYHEGVRDTKIKIAETGAKIFKYSASFAEIAGDFGLVTKTSIAWTKPFTLITGTISLIGGAAWDIIGMRKCCKLSKSLSDAKPLDRLKEKDPLWYKRFSLIDLQDPINGATEEAQEDVIGKVKNRLKCKIGCHTIALAIHAISLATLATAVVAIATPSLSVYVYTLYLSCVALTLVKIAYEKLLLGNP